MPTTSPLTEDDKRPDDRPPWDERDVTFDEDVVLDTLTVEHQESLQRMAAELEKASAS